MTQSRAKLNEKPEVIRCSSLLIPSKLYRLFSLCLLTWLTSCTTIANTAANTALSIKPLSRQIKQQEAKGTPPEPKQLKLGLLFSLSGNLARYGTTMQDSASLLVETVNRCGGVAKQAVQLFSQDDQSNATAGKFGISRLIQDDHVNAVIGAIGSEVSNATIATAVKHQVVQISPASASPILTQRTQTGEFRGFWFRTMPPDTFQGEALAQLADQRGFKTVAILTIANDYGNSIVQSFETTFKRLGGTITGAPIRYSPYAALSNVDWATAFSQQPDAVLLVAAPYLGSEILKTAYNSGVWSGNTRVLLTSSMKTENIAGWIGQANDGRYIASAVIGVAPKTATDSSGFKTDNPGMNAFHELYKKKFNREPNLYDPNTWDAAALIVLAAEAANATPGTAIKSQIAKVANPPGVEVSDVCQALSLVQDGKDIDYQGASGAVNFNQTGDIIGDYDVWTINYMGAIKVEATIQAGKNNLSVSKK